MKNHLIKKRIVIGYLGYNSVLARSFKNFYSKKFLFKHYTDDITNLRKIDLWLTKNNDINILINFAAITSQKKCERFKKKAKAVNFTGVVNLLKYLNKIKKHNISYFLSLSTSHVFKRTNLILKENSEKKPINYYGKSKLALEKYIIKNQNKFMFNVGIARVFNYYNKNLKKGFFVNDVIEKLKTNKKKISFYNINTYRDFISIKDINKAIFLMITLKLKNDYNICSGIKIFLPDIVSYLNKKYKKKILIINNKKNNSIVGSNFKLKKKGWKIIQKSFFNELPK